VYLSIIKFCKEQITEESEVHWKTTLITSKPMEMTNNKQQTEINAVEYLGKVKQFARENNPDKPQQQTAIEWLFDNVYMAHSELSEKLKQAKEMEKEQIEEAYKYARAHWSREDGNAERYYNETYGGNK
jgi:ADP-ribosylglycohydrolase